MRKNLIAGVEEVSRRYGIASVGCDIWTIITVINCNAQVLRRRDNILRGVASICIKPFSGSDYCVTIFVGFT